MKLLKFLKIFTLYFLFRKNLLWRLFTIMSTCLFTKILLVCYSNKLGNSFFCHKFCYYSNLLVNKITI
ncbi:hypothetical protein A1OE_1348 [Candidatus Endolissoclinum faulkneri L2]|uniref:Uncharacterized protein n=1 Tax=Candidatus Endolissoclinum faulkneri L2 TaxID=1193729 RepID=K7ZDH3_9PROT|nr:hypothetical protein A1OE_1348 [Candidatus Endolissoclinum faulkneri L2]